MARGLTSTVWPRSAKRLTEFRWTGSAALGGLISPANEFWTLAGSATQPIFDGFTLLHQKRAAEDAYDQAAATYRSTVIGALQKVADTLHALDEDASALKATVEWEHALAREPLLQRGGSFAFSSAPFQPFSGRGRCWSPKGNANINIQAAYLNWVGATGELGTLGREVFSSQSLPRQQLSYRFRIFRSARFFGLRNSAPVGVRPAVLFV